MSKSKMLSNDLENLEKKYECKCENIKKFLDNNHSNTALQSWEYCYNALSQIKRLRAIFEKIFR